MNKNQPNRSHGKLAMIIALVVAVLLATGYGVYAYQQHKLDRLEQEEVDSQQNSDDTDEQTATSTPSDDSYTVPEGYRLYSNDELAASFVIPDRYGELEVRQGNGETGSKISGAATASQNDFVRFAAHTNNYQSYGTDDPLVVYGSSPYVKEGRQYILSSGDDAAAMKDFEVISTRGGEAIMFTKPASTISSSSHIGLVNLDEDRDYAVVSFLANTLDELRTILASYKND